MNAEIELKNHMSNVLPEESVVRFEGKEYVFENKEKNTFEMMPVQTGNVHAGFIEIVSDTTLLDKSIVTKGAYALLMSLKNKEEEWVVVMNYELWIGNPYSIGKLVLFT